MREGISDYEKLKVLKDKLKTVKSRQAQAKVEQLESLLKKINEEKDFNKANLEDDIAKGKKVIEELSDILP